MSSWRSRPAPIRADSLRLRKWQVIALTAWVIAVVAMLWPVVLSHAVVCPADAGSACNNCHHATGHNSAFLDIKSQSQ